VKAYLGQDLAGVEAKVFRDEAALFWRWIISGARSECD